MADQNVQGVNVKISVDNSGITAGVSNAKAQFNSLTQGVQQSMTSANASLASTGAALDDVSNKTNNLGAAISSTGSRRELSEALSAMRAGADGTAGSFELLRVGLLTFAQGLGGPALIAISLVTAALVAGGTALFDYIQKQKQLAEVAAALQLPVDQVEHMSASMIDLAMSVQSVKAGLTGLNAGQVNIAKVLGLDPTNDADVTKGMQMLAQMPRSFQTITAAAELSGQSYKDASVALNQLNKDGEQYVNGAFVRSQMMTAAANTMSWDVTAGMKMMTEAMQKVSDSWPKPPKGGLDTSTALTTKQQEVQDELTKIAQSGMNARNTLIQNESQKILADAEVQIQALERERDSMARDNPTQATQINSTYNTDIDQTRAAAQAKAAQVAHEQQAQQEQAFQSALNAIINAGVQARVDAEKSGNDKIIDEGQQKLAALAEQYNKDVENETLRYQKGDINATKYNANLLALDQAYSTSAVEINQATDDKIAQYDEQNAIKREQYLNAYNKALTTLTKQAQQITADTGVDTNTQIQQQLQDRIDQANQLYEQDVANAQKALQEKLINEQQYDAEVLALEEKKNANIDVAYTQASQDQNKQFHTTLNNWSDMTKQMDSAFTQMTNDTANQLTTLLTTGKGSFDQFTQAIIADLMKIIVEKEIAGFIGSIASMFGGGISSTGAGVMSDNGLASDGFTMSAAGGVDIPAGVNPVTQLHEKEMVLPADLSQGVRDMVSGAQTSVTMGNSGSGGSGSTNVQVNIQNNGTPQQPAQKPQVTQTPQGMVVSIFLDDLKKSGPMSTGISNAFGVRKQG